MVVGEAARVHEGPPHPRVHHRAVVANEASSPALVVDARPVEAHVDGVGGGVVVGPQERLLGGPVPDNENKISVSVAVVAEKDLLRQGFDVLFEDPEGLLLVLQLGHVDVHGGDILVATGDPLIGVLAPGPFAEVLCAFYQLVAEAFREHGEPVDVGARHFVEGFEVQGGVVVWVQVPLLPVFAVGDHLPHVWVEFIHWVVRRINQMSVVL